MYGAMGIVGGMCRELVLLGENPGQKSPKFTIKVQLSNIYPSITINKRSKINNLPVIRLVFDEACCEQCVCYISNITTVSTLQRSVVECKALWKAPRDHERHNINASIFLFPSAQNLWYFSFCLTCIL